MLPRTAWPTTDCLTQLTTPIRSKCPIRRHLGPLSTPLSAVHGAKQRQMGGVNQGIASTLPRTREPSRSLGLNGRHSNQGIQFSGTHEKQRGYILRYIYKLAPPISSRWFCSHSCHFHPSCPPPTTHGHPQQGSRLYTFLGICIRIDRTRRWSQFIHQVS
jgi:hypothetical protein